MCFVRHIKARQLIIITPQIIQCPSNYSGISGSKTKALQLDTGDIAWAIFFCRLGLGGLLLFLLFYYKLSRAFWKSRQQNKLYSFYFVSLIVFLFFTSFGNTIIAMDDFYIYPILLVYQIVMKEKENLLRTIKN